MTVSLYITGNTRPKNSDNTFCMVLFTAKCPDIIDFSANFVIVLRYCCGTTSCTNTLPFSTLGELYCLYIKVSNGAKIRNRYNQVPHLTQDTNGKVTNSQKTPQTRAKRSALSQQVTTKHI